MDPSLIPFAIAAGAGVSGLVVWLAVRSHRARWQAWEAVGARLGLARVKRGFFKTDALVGDSGGVALVADTYTQSYGESSQTFTRVTADHPGLPLDLQVAKEGLLAGLAKRVWTGEDVQTGDAGFDDHMLLRGPEDHLLAVLDGVTREAVRGRLSEPGVTVKKGQATVEDSGTVRDPRKLEAWILATRDQALALALDPTEVPGRLARNAADELLADVRCRNLAVLATGHPDHPATAPAVAAALTDGDPSVRLVAAWHQRPRTREWPGAVGDEAVLVRLLDHPRTGIQTLACHALRESGSLGSVAPLRALEGGTRDSGVRGHALEAIRAIQGRLGAERAGGLAVLETPPGAAGGLAVSGGPLPAGGLAVSEEAVEEVARQPGSAREPERS